MVETISGRGFLSGIQIARGLQQQQRQARMDAEAIEQQEFGNLLATTKPIINAFAQKGDTEGLNTFISTIQDQNPQFSQFFAQIPAGTDLAPTGDDPSDRFVTFNEEKVMPDGSTKVVQSVIRASELAELTKKGEQPAVGFGGLQAERKAEVKKAVGKEEIKIAKKKEEVKLPFDIAKERRAVKRSPDFRGLNTGQNQVGKAIDIITEDPKVFRDVIGRKFGTNKKAAAFQTAVDTSIRQLVASISGKVVTNEEAKAYRQSFEPKVLNTPEVARQKLEELDAIFELNKELLLNPDDESIEEDMRRIITGGGIVGTEEAVEAGPEGAVETVTAISINPAKTHVKLSDNSVITIEEARSRGVIR